MGKMQVTGLEDFSRALESLGNAKTGVLKYALYEGVKVVREEVEKRIASLPVDKSRFLRDGDKYNVITRTDLEDLKRSLGVAKMQEAAGGVRTSISFDGYGSVKTSKYPNGRPMIMIARSIESGSSVRTKIPFVRQAVNASRPRAVAAMEEATHKKIKEIMEE